MEQSASYNAYLISIHALLAESDGQCKKDKYIILISIHALLAESDYETSVLLKCQVKFLSTLSLRRATGLGVGLYLVTEISIHALLAESDDDLGDRLANYCISIHALLAESDPSTPGKPTIKGISIHALLAESDRTL